MRVTGVLCGWDWGVVWAYVMEEWKWACGDHMSAEHDRHVSSLDYCWSINLAKPRPGTRNIEMSIAGCRYDRTCYPPITNERWIGDGLAYLPYAKGGPLSTAEEEK